jgi:cytochrome c oxidase subunit II
VIAAVQVAQSALDAAGAASARIERIWWLMFWVTTLVFLVTMALTAIAVVRRREREPGPPIVDTETTDAVMTPVVAAAVAATTVILFVFLVASVWASKGLTTVDATAPAVSIELTGHQWWWEAQYEDPTPALIARTANEIHIPVGQPVVMKVTSRDVIHSLWIPNLQGKRDLIPGYTTAIWLRADRPGVYRGQCAEFCGLQHAHMSLIVVAEANDQYQRWLAAQRQEAATPATPAEQHGRDVFLTATCTQCHTIRGTIAGATLGPDLTHVASRGTLAAATVPNTIGHLAGWIADPQRIKPGNRMPPNSIRGDDLQALLSYLESLK